jgi:hypothetical protein
MRTCARDGCPNPVTSRHASARYCSDACKSAQWRADAGYRVVGVRKACQTPKKRRRQSGMQVSWAKAVAILEAEYTDKGLVAEDAHASAVWLLRNALSDKQRARLDARDGQ